MNATGVTVDRWVEERAYFQAVLDAVNDAIFAHDAATGAMLDVNETACRLYGYSRQEMLALSIGQLSAGISPYAQEDALAWIAQARHDGPKVVEWMARHQSGRLFWVEVTIRFAHIGSLDRVLVTVRDIEARKKAEEALQQSDGRIRSLLQHVPSVAVQAYRPSGEVTYWNPASERMYGYTAEEALGRNLVDLIIPLEIRDMVQQAIRGMAESGNPIPAGEVELLRKGGARVPVYSCHAVVPMPGGEPVLFCMDVDLTDTRRAEQTRIDMERRLLHSQKLESLGLLAGGIAHDFNNLLTAILGNLDLAALDVPAESPAHPCLEHAVKAVRRAADLTRQMLAYSGQGHFVVEDMSLTDLVEENVHILRAAVPRSITIDLRLHRRAPLIRADRSQVQQVIMNLIVNASEAIGTSTGTITVSTECGPFDREDLDRSRLETKPPPGSFVYLTVTDTGGGMEPATLQRLFDPFFSTKGAGRGLGLSAVMGIMRGHQGAIMVQSQPGTGTRMDVLFPASIPAVGVAPAPAATASAAQLHPPNKGLLLLVDDEPDVLSLCKRLVERLGFQAVTATDGVEAVEAFMQQPDAFAGCIIDMTMPRMDGVTCVNEIRRIRPNAKVILSSGFTQADITRRFGDAGLSGFAQKPYDLATLRAELQRVLQRPA